VPPSGRARRRETPVCARTRAERIGHSQIEVRVQEPVVRVDGAVEEGALSVLAVEPRALRATSRGVGLPGRVVGVDFGVAVGAGPRRAVVGLRAGIPCFRRLARPEKAEEARPAALIELCVLGGLRRAIVSSRTLVRILGARAWPANQAVCACNRGRHVCGTICGADPTRRALLALQGVLGSALKAVGALWTKTADGSLHHRPVLAHWADDRHRSALRRALVATGAGVARLGSPLEPKIPRDARLRGEGTLVRSFVARHCGARVDTSEWAVVADWAEGRTYH
jgi:hypothetical protein